MSNLYRNMAKLVDICYDNLQKNKLVKDYLKKRGITQKTIDTFFLGAFPSDLRVLLKSLDIDFLKQNGILYQADKSAFRFYPLIIPILDVNKNFIGIGGRNLMPEEQRKGLGYPKYKNSEYAKVQHLFGLNYAKKAIREKNTAIVVEGYFDVISSYQAGLENVVATSGTYLSARQTLLLSRYAENIHVLFDNDEAGRKASARFIEKCATNGIKLKEIYLPDGFKDIDEYIITTKTDPRTLEIFK